MEVRVPRRFVVPEDRRVFAAIGTWALTEGALQLLDTSASRRLWLAPLWPVMLVAGGAVMLAFLAGGMRSFLLRAWGTALLVTSCAGRAAALTLGIREGTAATPWSGWSGVGAWSMIGFLLYVTLRARVPLVEDADQATID